MDSEPEITAEDLTLTTMDPEPTVKLTPDFKIGETIQCKSTGEKFEILEIARGGALRLAGRAGLMPAEAAEKILP